MKKLLLLPLFLVGCASSPNNSDAIASRFGKASMINCTNCVQYISVYVSGGADVSPQMAMGTDVATNLFREAASAYKFSNGTGAAEGVLKGAGEAAVLVKKIEAAKP